MVRATIVVSAFLVLVASVSAVPSVIKVKAGDHIGTGNIYAEGTAQHAVYIPNTSVTDAVNVANDNGRGKGVVNRLVGRREEEAPIRIVKKAGVKGMKKMAKKAAKKAQKI